MTGRVDRMIEAGETRDEGAFCLFRCRARPLAIALGAVIEVVEPVGLVRLPQAPPRVLGLCAYRRGIVPLLRLTDEEAPAGGPLALMVRGEHGAWGLQIDGDGVSVIEDARPKRAAGLTDWAGLVLDGSIAWAGSESAVLDPSRTWQGFRDVITSWYEMVQGRGGSEASGREA